MVKTLSFTLNGQPTRLKTDIERTLLWLLRTDLGLTGTKYGCGENHCGTCTVLVGGEPVRSCQLPAADVEGQEVVTIEGLSTDGNLHPLQQAFLEHDAFQCGYCTPGMIMSAYGLLLKNPRPSRQEIVRALEDNLCRCGSHNRVISAVLTASNNLE